MKVSSENIASSTAILLVAFLTFMSHETQTMLMNSIDSFLNSLFDVFLPSSSMFDTRLFMSNFAHLTVFCTLGYAAGTFAKRFSIVKIMSVLILIALASESAQLFVAGRETSLNDLVINISAVATGLFISIQRRRTRKNLPRRRHQE